MKVAVAQLGPRQHYAEARILYAEGVLERLFTDAYLGDKPLFRRIVRAVPGIGRLADIRRLLARDAVDIPAERVTSFDGLGLFAQFALRRARSEAERYRVYDEVGRAFQRAVIRCGLGAADTLLVSTGAAADLAAFARRVGVRSVLQQFDHPMQTLDRLLREERERWSGAELAPPEPLPDRLARRLLDEERRALEEADLILVASNYTRRTLADAGLDLEGVRIVPLAVDLQHWRADEQLSPRRDPRLRVLYAGQIDLRKGVLYLVEALKKLRTKQVVLRLAGSVALRQELLAVPNVEVEVLGPIPRSDMPSLMRWADLFVFPTLGEGFGLVQVEALACGTPVIATTECGEVVRDGIDGHIVPPRDPDAIARWLDHYAADPRALAPMREAAVRRARDFSLDAYASRFVASLTTIGRHSESLTVTSGVVA